MRIKKALISVSDKTALEEFVKGLNRLGVEIISTGGTAKFISSLGVSVTEVSSCTNYPEMLGGRVKTLHPVIHAGLLAVRGNEEHAKEMKEKGIPYIDMVVVNLYPFEETIASEGVTVEEAVENIDIGGPSMLRSAAKNFEAVAAVSSPDQYKEILSELEKKGCELSGGTLKRLAVQAFKKISSYDNLIQRYLSGGRSSTGEEKFPDSLSVELEKLYKLRYGENPHQKAALYKDSLSADEGITGAQKLQGKELSFNNIVDTSTAMEIVTCFERPAAAIVKHNSPCGVAAADTLETAYVDALDCDRMSAFGGIIAFNASVKKSMAELVLKEGGFIECIAAPDYEKNALEIFKRKKDLRVLKMAPAKRSSGAGIDMKKVAGGFLIQDRDAKEISREALKIVTKEKPAEGVIDSLIFAWKIVKYVKSNAIVLCQGSKTVGIGAGQMSRVDSVITAVRKAGSMAKGSALASDAFFPVPDSIEEAHKAGIAAIIQPGGSIRDKEIIAACDRFKIPMVFTGTRHFRH